MATLRGFLRTCWKPQIPLRMHGGRIESRRAAAHRADTTRSLPFEASSMDTGGR